MCFPQNALADSVAALHSGRVLTNYRRLFGVPHVLSLLVWSLAARFYMPGQMIAVTFLVEDWTGTYSYAGLVAGAFTLGMALVGPLRGRMADRGGSDRLVMVCGVVFAAGMVTLALLPAFLWWMAVPLALVTGVFGSPANQIVRGLWPRLTRGPERQAIYAAEATTQELLFVFSPIVTAAVVTWAGPRAAMLMLAVLALAGAVGFFLALRRARVTGPAPVEEGAEEPGGRRRSLIRVPALALLFTMALLAVGGVIGMDLTIVAWANELNTPQYVMVLASVWALGSLVGGAIAGALPGSPRLVRRSLAATAGLMLLVPFMPPVLHLPTPLLVLPLLFLSGMTLAPLLAAVMGRIGDLAPSDRRSEAFGWMATALGTGGALASPAVGAMIDALGVAGGVAGAGLGLLAASGLSLFVRPPSEARPGVAEDTGGHGGSGSADGALRGPAEPGRSTGGPAPAGPTAPAVSPHPPQGR
ncbi:MFS transporter [Nocardiopsis kunsanensis]|uniref:MFS transporter n=1 Tax=Nocardiopsis kunsanensis TaxID=141693 RepID=A0A918XJS9_9ACTN|nr:MFS transporter [Nocardiopsis kunsanensis]